MKTSVARMKANRKYRQSDKGKANRKLYNKSEASKVVQERYNQTDKGKATQKNYNKSDERKIAQKRYNQKDKRKASNKRYQQSDEGKVAKRFYVYHLSGEDYNKLLDQQEGRCKLCERSLLETKSCVDHDHLTNKVRGILCRKCNLALGLFDDNICKLLNAVKYLEENK